MSGSTAGGILGAAVGYYFGGAQGAQTGWMVGSVVGGEISPDVIKGQRLTDAQQQTTMEGAPRSILYGTAVVAGNVIHAGPLVEHKDSARTGKGGPVQESFTYTRSYAIRVCEGPIGNISRIWRDDKLVYDVRNPSDWPDAATDISNMAGQSAKFGTGITIYTGDETQLPDPTLEALPTANGGGVGEVCAHRGTCYVVFADDDLTDRQGAIPQYRFEVSCCGDTTTSVNPIAWVHGDTGSDQSIFSGSIYGLDVVVAGWNNNLRNSTDGGATWQAVAYADSLAWDIADPIWAVWSVPDVTGRYWYMALADSVAISYTSGANWVPYITPVHTLAGQVYFVAGGYYAGATDTVNTTIFQPHSLADTDIDLGADYGGVSSIGDLGGQLVVGTDIGKIVNGGGTVLYTDPGGRAITQFACNEDATVCIALLATAGYLRSTDGGSTWAPILTGSLAGVVFARNQFYFSAVNDISSSDDGLTMTQVDDSFATVSGGGLLLTDGFSVLATADIAKVAVLPSAYVLPDIAAGWHIDNLGSIVGDTVTSVDRCVAQLDATVLDILSRVGITSAQVDVTQLADMPLRGFVIGQPMAASDAIRTLQQGYFFDVPEWGDSTDASTKLRAILRGGATAFDITDDDLVQSDDDEDARAQAVEFPRKINLITSDVDSDYNPTKQTFERRTDNIKAVGESTVQLALSTLRTEAAPMVDIMGKIAWEEALGRCQFELPAEFSALTPSDCFTKSSKRWCAERCEYGDGTVKVEAVRDRARAYVSTATPSDAPAPTSPPVTLRGPTAFAAMNLPSLRTADNVPGMYVAVCGLLDGWVGCDLYLSVDLGLSYALVRTMLSEATMGKLSSTCDSGATDLITASLLHGHEIDSVTASQIATRANAFAILTNGPNGVVAEIGQAQTATETATAGTYDLTDLTRGELGTTAAAHYTGDRFVMLDGSVEFLPLDISLAGKTLYFRPVSRGTAVANNAVYQVQFLPQFTSVTAIDFIQTKSGDVIRTLAGDYLQALA